MSMIQPPSVPPTLPAERPAPRARVPDPGSPRGRLIALIVLIVFFAATFYMQQAQHAAPLPAPGINPGTVDPPGADPTTWVSKFAVKFSHSDLGAGSGPTMIPQLDQGARSPEEKIRVAIVVADLVGPEQAIERLKSIADAHGLDEALVTGAALPEKLESSQAEPTEPGPPPPADTSADASPQTDPRSKRVTDGMPNQSPPDATLNPLLIEDLQTLGALYRGQQSAVTDQQREGLVDRHGWFARLAFTQSLPDTDPARQELIGGGSALVLLTLGIGLGFVVFFLAGIGLLIFILVQIAGRRVTWRMDPPAPGGSVYLETVAVFVFSFIAFKVLMELLVSPGSPTGPGQALRISAQWLLVLPIFWPLVRGVSFADMRRAIGWHSGRGVFREIGAGLVAYVAGIPILVGAAIFAFILIIVWEAIKSAMGQPPSPPPENPIIDLIGGSDPWVIVSFAVLATVWAPIVEEAIFRGCLYRHARSRVGAVIAGLVSAVVFGGMHGYAGPLLLPVTSLGFVFALMREWRGSLIGPAVAHFVHNATVTCLLLVFLWILGK